MTWFVGDGAALTRPPGFVLFLVGVSCASKPFVIARLLADVAILLVKSWSVELDWNGKTAAKTNK